MLQLTVRIVDRLRLVALRRLILGLQTMLAIMDIFVLLSLLRSRFNQAAGIILFIDIA